MYISMYATYTFDIPYNVHVYVYVCYIYNWFMTFYRFSASTITSFPFGQEMFVKKMSEDLLQKMDGGEIQISQFRTESFWRWWKGCGQKKVTSSLEQFIRSKTFLFQCHSHFVSLLAGKSNLLLYTGHVFLWKWPHRWAIMAIPWSQSFN